MKKKLTPGRVLMYVFLIIAALIFAAPMLFTVLSSLKTKVEIFQEPFGMPEVIQWSNYTEAWTEANMGVYFINSLIQSLATVVLLAVVSSMAAYVLSRFDFKCN